jgi:hypothetical protein
LIRRTRIECGGLVTVVLRQFLPSVMAAAVAK